MDVSLLQTKLHILRVQADRVPRPRRLERPDQPHRLTLVASWTSTRPARVAWLSLNVADDDPGRFWTYVVAALQAALQAKPQTVHPALGDDYHLITSRAAESRRVGSETLIESLSERKLQVLHLLAKGKTNHEIGDALFIAIGTVKKHLSTKESQPREEMMTSKGRKTSCLGVGIRTVGVLATLLAVTFVTLALNQRIAQRRFMQRTPLPGQRFDIGGHQLHLHCTGSGKPTIVIDAGNGCLGLEWTPVQEALAETARVCTYDRAGYGWSEAGPSPRDGATAATELHALLQAAGEPGPYLLVGHSLGGAHARIFAARYPELVAGLVLVDTAADQAVSPEREAEMRASIGFYRIMRLLAGSGLLRVLGPLGGEGAMPETALKLPPELQETYLNLLLDPKQYATAIDEMEQLPATLRQVEKAMAGKQPLGDRPLIVLTAGQRMAPGATPFDNRRVPVDQAIIDAQGALAALSLRGEQRVIAESGHQMHLDAPKAVSAAVRDVIRLVPQ